ncbi:hypothetical protein RvVAR031_28210 [Agrobacterium vitis]|nr:hypothetical protein RvVAR031_28210 [Agrobacterium vitis]
MDGRADQCRQKGCGGKSQCKEQGVFDHGGAISVRAVPKVSDDGPDAHYLNQNPVPFHRRLVMFGNSTAKMEVRYGGPACHNQAGADQKGFQVEDCVSFR